MKTKPTHRRFLTGAAAAFAALIIGFTWTTAILPTWGSTQEEIGHRLPADEQVSRPTLEWNHALTIQAPASEIYPWLVQLGDSRAAFYSITFIENAFCALSGECRYVNADRIHPEWQTPAKGQQGIIMDFLVIEDYQPDQYVLAGATGKMPLKWTWLWYLDPIDTTTTRLIVRHRVAYPPDAPEGLIDTVFSLGYIMERGMMLGIKARAEGNTPAPASEALGAVLWLLVFAMGVAAAVRFARAPRGYHALGVGLEAVAVLFVLTYIQPPMIWRGVLTLMVAAGLAVEIWRNKQNDRGEAHSPAKLG